MHSTPLNGRTESIAPKGQTLLVELDPPDIVRLPRAFTRKFSGRLPFPGLNWYVEMKWQEALEREHWPKSKMISAVISSKQNTSGHRRRFKLMTALKAHFGDRLDWFGHGVRELGKSKVNGLIDYRYHIVLENGSHPHYWTEKLADAFVTNCFPFYWGAPNISEYFDPNSMQTIDIDDPAGTIRTIEYAIAADEYGRAQAALASSRRRVLVDYHPYGACLLFTSLVWNAAWQYDGICNSSLQFPPLHFCAAGSSKGAKNNLAAYSMRSQNINKMLSQ